MRAFLAAYVKNPDRIPLVMDLLEPFFRHVERGTYSLARSEELDAGIVARTITTATEQRVQRVVFSPRSQRLPQLFPDSEERLIDRTVLLRTLPSHLWNPLEHALAYSFMSDLGCILSRFLDDQIGHDRTESIERYIRDAVSCLLGFVLRDDAVSIRRLTPLVQLLSRALPIGRKYDERDTVVVLTA